MMYWQPHPVMYQQPLIVHRPAFVRPPVQPVRVVYEEPIRRLVRPISVIDMEDDSRYEERREQLPARSRPARPQTAPRSLGSSTSRSSSGSTAVRIAGGYKLYSNDDGEPDVDVHLGRFGPRYTPGRYDDYGVDQSAQRDSYERSVSLRSLHEGSMMGTSAKSLHSSSAGSLHVGRRLGSSRSTSSIYRLSDGHSYVTR